MFFCFFVLFVYPVRKKATTQKQTVTYLRCADRRLNAVRQQCGDAEGGNPRHMTTSWASRPLPPVTRSLIRDNTTSQQTHARINSGMSTNQIIWWDSNILIHSQRLSFLISSRLITIVYHPGLKKMTHSLRWSEDSDDMTTIWQRCSPSSSECNAGYIVDTLIRTEISIQTWYKYTRISIIHLINLYLQVCILLLTLRQKSFKRHEDDRGLRDQRVPSPNILPPWFSYSSLFLHITSPAEVSPPCTLVRIVVYEKT